MAKYETIIVWADFMASGLWVPRPRDQFPHIVVAIGHYSVEMPEELSDRFKKWIDWYWDVYDRPETFDVREFNAEGAMLAAELQAFLGAPHESGTVVFFRPERIRTPEELKKYYRGRSNG